MARRFGYHLAATNLVRLFNLSHFCICLNGMNCKSLTVWPVWLVSGVDCEGDIMSYEINPTVEHMLAASDAERRMRTGQALVAVTGLELLERNLQAEAIELPQQQ